MYKKKEAPMYKLLNSFHSVYHTRSFTRSAEELFFSQPTLSKHIKNLEEMVGTNLFERRGANELVPTKAAHMVYNSTSRFINEWTELMDTLQNQRDDFPSYVLGISHTFASLYLADMMDYLFDLYDYKINFDIRIINSTQVRDAVEDNEVNLGFIEKPLRMDLVNYHELCQDELVLAGNLESDLWLIRENASGVRHFTEEYMQTRNIHERVMKVNNNNAITDILRKGIGKSIISRGVAGDIPYTTLSGNNTRYFYLIERESSEAGKLLVQQIVDYFNTLCKQHARD